LLAGRAQKRTNDAHADTGTSDTGEKQLSTADVINDGGPFTISNGPVPMAHGTRDSPVKAPNIEVQLLTKLS